MKRILSLDQSSKDIGVGRIRCEYKDGAYYDIELMHFKETGAACLKRWDDWLTEELSTRGTDPYDLVICEDYARVFASGIINHKILGLIELACFKRNVALVKVPIQTLKLYATGDGGAEKHQMILAAQVEQLRMMGDGVIPAVPPLWGDDESDAYWLLDIGYHLATGLRTGCPRKDQIIDTLSRTPEQIKADKLNAQLAKAAATIAADEAKKTKALVAQLRSEARAQRQAEAQRKREEKAAKKEAVLL